MNETLSEEQLFDLRQAFASVDHNNDGLVNTKDIPLIFEHLDQSYKSFVVEGDDLQRLVDKVDIDDSKKITFTQFLTIIAYKMNANETEEELLEAFYMFDRTNSGFITFDDLWHVMQRLGENISKTDVQEMMREADRDLDGKISITEFVEMIRHNKQ